MLLGWAYAAALEEFFPLPVIETPLQPRVFLRAAAVGFVLPFAAAAYPVWRGVRMKPIEAIEIGFRAGKGSGLASLLKRIPLPGPTFAEMPIRDTLRTPRRTLMTVIGVAAVVAVVVAFYGMIDSFGATIDRSRTVALRGDPSRMTVALDHFYARSRPEVRNVVTSPAVGNSAASLRVPSTLVAGDSEVDVFVELVDPDSRLWQPSVSAGSFPRGSEGILRSRRRRPTISASESATSSRCGIRGAPAPRRSSWSRRRSEVAGLDPDPLRFHAYLGSEQARLMGLEGMTNTLSVTPAAGASQDEVTRSLFGKPGVASVEAVTASLDAVEDYIQDFTAVHQVSAFVVMLLALLIAFNSTSINADERVREHATMFAFGLPVRTVLTMSVAESLIKGILATLLGLGLGSP